MEMKIYHNPRCRKSRETLELIRENGIEPQIIEYLKEPPTIGQLKEILAMLGIPAEKLIRRNEEIFKEKFKGNEYSEEDWIQIMVDNPKLIERPIVISDGRAVVGRPPTNVSQLID